MQDLYKIDKHARMRINTEHVEAGVEIMDLDNTYIGPDVQIGTGTIVLPGCMIYGETKIGTGCVIGPNCRLADMTVGENIKIEYAVAEKSFVGDGSTIGPFAYIRPGSVLGKNVKIGDFVEVKNAVIGDGSKASHLAYVGDADVGTNVNFGCGAITVNYDGKAKHRTTIEDGAFVGSNSNLVAPVIINKGAYVAAGSTITKDVPEDALGIGRAKQSNIEGWASKRRAKN